MSNLTQKKCMPCEGGVAKLTPEETREYLKQVDGWQTDEKATKISKQFAFPSFMDAIAFVNKVADIAEDENHHPDIHMYYNKITFEIWTHAIEGLSENDFILAAKINGAAG